MRSMRRQRNLPPEALTTMENMEGRLRNSTSNARLSPSPIALKCPLSVKSLNNWRTSQVSKNLDKAALGHLIGCIYFGASTLVPCEGCQMSRRGAKYP